jgi:hypothetical protein
MNEENTTEVLRLPLWKNCLEEMLSDDDPVAHGRTYSSEYFEKHLKETRNTMKFGLAISEIRRELEKKGFYLSGRGQKGDQFIILPAEANQDVMLSYQRAAIDAMKRGVILGTTTRLDFLNEADRTRHEKILEKLAWRVALVAKCGKVVKALGDKATNLLK